MKRALLPIFVFALLVVILFIGVQRAPEKTVIPSALIGKSAPAFTLPILGSDQAFSESSMRGRWYLLNVWGTWCPECLNEHEILLEIARSERVPIIGLNWKDDAVAAQSWLSQLGDPYDIVAVDRDGEVAIEWGVYGAPETFLIDAMGKVIYKHVGPMTREIWQREFVARLPPAGSNT